MGNLVISIWIILRDVEGVCGVMIIVIGNRHDDPSSNPRQGCLHFT